MFDIFLKILKLWVHVNQKTGTIITTIEQK